MSEPFGRTVPPYNFEDALADGLYEEVTWLAKTYGYPLPIALTQGVREALGLATERSATQFRSILACFLIFLRPALDHHLLRPNPGQLFPTHSFRYQGRAFEIGYQLRSAGGHAYVVCLADQP